MITLEQLNQLRMTANGYRDGDGEGVLIDMLEQLIPFLPPMVGMVVSEFLHSMTIPNPHIHTEDTQ